MNNGFKIFSKGNLDIFGGTKMNMFEVWLLLVLIPKLPCIFAPIAVISAIGCLIAIAWWMICYGELKDEDTVESYKEGKIWTRRDENHQQSSLKNIRGARKLLKYGIITLCTSSLLIASIPNRKEVVAIVLIPYVSNNPEFQKLPENIVGMLNDLIKEYRKELSPIKESNHD